jgi:hypothetical protein
MTRQTERAAFDVTTRLALLEHDADTHDEAMSHLREELRAMNRILTGILVSVATAALLLAINLAINSVGGG